MTPGLRHHAMVALHHGCDSHAHRKPHCLACLRPTTNSCWPASCRTREYPCLSLPALALCACAPTQPGHNPHSSLLTLTSWPNGQLALMEWLPMLLALVSPHYTSAYTFARGTHQPSPIGSARGCTDLEELLRDPQDYAEAIDLCFDDQFSCPHAKPFVGEAMILGSSEDNPAMIQLKDSDDWLTALVPVPPWLPSQSVAATAPASSRRATTRATTVSVRTSPASKAHVAFSQPRGPCLPCVGSCAAPRLWPSSAPPLLPSSAAGDGADSSSSP